MERSPTRRALRLAATLILVAASACGVDQFQFRNDHRLTLEAPEPRALVELPLTVSWAMEDFEAVGLDGSAGLGKGAFVVFVDRAPMPVGRDLRWVMRNAPGCEVDSRCPTVDQLAERDIYETTDTEIVLHELGTSSTETGDEEHYINVVLVNGLGERMLESAWYLPFKTERDA